MIQAYDPISGALFKPTVRRVVSTATFVRPADTTAYTAGDVVGPVTTPAVQKLTGVGRANGGTGKIVDLKIICDLATITNGTFRVHFFNATLTPAADNAVFAGLQLNGANYLGYVDPPILVADAAGSLSGMTEQNAGIGPTKGLPLQFVCASGDTALYAVIIALAAYTPSSSENFRLTIIAEQD